MDELSGSSEQPLGKKLIINAALTGNIHKKDDSPDLPVTPDEIADDAARCFKAGATIFHLHAREGDGTPSCSKDVFAEIISKVRKRCPQAILCATTSGRIYKDFKQRAQVLELEGDLKPELVSLSPGSTNFPDCANSNPPDMVLKLAKAIQSRGLRPELEILDIGMANFAVYMLRKGYLKRPVYANLMLGVLGAMPGRVSDLCYLAGSLPEGFIWGAGGAGRFQLTMNTVSMLMGGHVRVGLEDSLFLDHQKEEPATNEILVKRIVRLAEELKRPIASPSEARAILDL